MESKNVYQTRQRKQLTEYFSRNAQRALSIGEISSDLCACYGIGKSTVYRLVGKLVEEGLLRRFRSEEDKSVLYQYSGGMHCENHLHLKCLQCGKVVHLHCEKMTEMLSHLGADHDFEVDVSKCVLYGICSECRMLADMREDCSENEN